MTAILADTPSTIPAGFGFPALDDHSTVSFPDGLPGFPDCREFVLLPASTDALAWLQSLEQEHLALLLAVPEVVCGESAAMADGFRKKGLHAAVIVTLPGADRPTATANLKAPVVIDAEARVARQVILPDSRLGVAHPFDLKALLRRET